LIIYNLVQRLAEVFIFLTTYTPVHSVCRGLLGLASIETES